MHKILEVEMQQCIMWASWWHTRIVSGDYHRDELSRGDGTFLMEDEKLARAVGIMEQHISEHRRLIELYRQLPIEKVGE